MKNSSKIARNRFEWAVQLANFNTSGVILSEKTERKKNIKMETV